MCEAGKESALSARRWVPERILSWGIRHVGHRKFLLGCAGNGGQGATAFLASTANAGSVESVSYRI
jgi:hypothetical protein